MIPADVIQPDYEVRVRYENPINYLGKFLAYESLDPILKNAYGTQHGMVIGVMVTIPELGLPQELLLATEGEPDFICLNEVRVLSVTAEPPAECA